MKYILKSEKVVIPSGVTVEVKARVVTVKGPKGTLKKVSNISKPKLKSKKKKMNIHMKNKMLSELTSI